MGLEPGLKKRGRKPSTSQHPPLFSSPDVIQPVGSSSCCCAFPIVMNWPQRDGLTTPWWTDHTLMNWPHRDGLTTPWWTDHPLMNWPHPDGLTTPSWTDYTLQWQASAQGHLGTGVLMTSPVSTFLGVLVFLLQGLCHTAQAHAYHLHKDGESPSLKILNFVCSFSSLPRCQCTEASAFWGLICIY